MSKSEKPTQKTKVERVSLIADMMIADTWNTNKVWRQDLADSWGVTTDTLKHDASEASRMLRWDKDDLEAMRISNVFWLLKLAERATVDASTVTGLSDLKTAIDARVKASEYAGLKLDEPAPGTSGPERPQQIRIVLAGQQLPPEPELKPEPSPPSEEDPEAEK